MAAAKGVAQGAQDFLTVKGVEIGVKKLSAYGKEKGWKWFATKLAKNPEAQSAVGKILLKRAPALAARLGLSAGLTVSGLGTAFGLAMSALTVYDIYQLTKEVPELMALVMEEEDLEALKEAE